MHNIKTIRDNPDAFDKEMQRRGINDVAKKILELDSQVRRAKTDLQELQQKSNDLAKQIGQLKSQGKDADSVIKESKKVKEQLASLKKQIDEQDKTGKDPVEDFLSKLPNVLDKEVPDGKDEEDNIEIRKWGKIKSFAFTPKEHFELGEDLGLMDFEQTAKISGSRFASLKGDLAQLERAIANFMVDIHTQEFDYQLVSPPLLVRDDAMFGSGQLPKFEEDSFQTTNGYRLIPTSEVSLVNMVRESILDEEELPIRYTALTPCFRSEAGSAGRDTRGIIRQHQFWKVELVSITDENSSADELERKIACAEEVLQRLELPYRVVTLCSGDTGFCAHKTYDIEVWLPGQNKYRETSSCSNCGDFQARRMKARYKKDNKNKFVHTLNGSGLAVGRVLIAIMENYQNNDGSITIPNALKKYFNKNTIGGSK